MLANAWMMVVLGWVVCLATYYAIQRHQILPVIASASSSLVVILLIKTLSLAPDLTPMLWQGFLFGSSFCGMNNNRWVNFRNIHMVWLLYALFFAIAYHYLPLPGGFLGTLALLASCIWILCLASLQKWGSVHATPK